MAEEGFKRKLAAILSADVEGYSRLMDDNEEATVRTLTSYRTAITDLVQQYRGRVVDSIGDNILAEFASVVDSVNCAVEIQRELAERNAELPDNRKMPFRIGVNLGDVIDEDGRIYGDGVNIAARVESMANAGGICISGRAHDQVENKLGLEYEDLGKHEVKNISRPIQVYRVLSHPGAAAHRVVQAKETLERKWRKIGFSATAIVIVFVAFGIWQYYAHRPSVEPASVEKMAHPLPDKPSIAVLPFDNMSGDPKQEYFSDGFTDQIIASLSMVPKIFVIARNSTFTYKNKAVKVQQVAEDLGVRYILEGSIQKEGQRVRITAQLVDAISGRHLWAERYDRELKDIFALQDEITIRIITELRVKITAGEHARVLYKGTKNLSAYLKFLQAYEYFQVQTKEKNALARRLSEEVIAIDPEFPQAYTLLGATYWMDLYLGSSKSPKLLLKKAFELNKKAIALNDSIPSPHYNIGWLYVLAGKHDEAIAECERGISLNPNSANAHLFMGMALRYAGRHEEAVRSAERALRLNPIPSSALFRSLGLTYLFVGRYDDAIAGFNKSLDRSPNDLLTHFSLACVYSLAGRDEDAQVAAEKVLQINPNFSLEQFGKRLTYKNQTDKELIIGAARKAGLPDKPPLPLPDKPSIAILAFDNLSGDPEQEYFSDGIAENIITALSKVGELFVIARNSSFTYKGKPVKVQQVGHELGVRYVLEGSVQKSGDRVRITAQLIDALSGNHLWAERYDRDLKDIFAMQDEITMKIMTALRVRLTGGEQARVYGKGTNNLEAYLKVMKGYERVMRFTKDDVHLGRQLYKEAIALDPNYSNAYTLLAWTHRHDVSFGWTKTPEKSTKKGIELVKKALSINEYDALAHMCLSNIYSMMREPEKAIAEGEKGIALEPNGAVVNATFAIVLIYAGRYDQAIEKIEKAERLNPISPGWYFWLKTVAFQFAGKYEKAIESAKKGLEKMPNHTSILTNLAASYILLGRMEEASAVTEKILELQPKFSLDQEAKILEHKFKNKADVERHIDALRKAGLPE